MDDPRLILLDPRDTVLVARRRLRAGEVLQVAGIIMTLASDLPLGHKVARRAMAPGDTVVKYGAPIGVATVAIAPGTHVHVHNVVSAYTPTYTLDAHKPPETAP